MELFQVFAMTVITISLLTCAECERSKATCQRQIVEACRQSQCTQCQAKSHQNLVKEIGKTISWSDFQMKCNIDQLKVFLSIQKCMLYNPEDGNEEIRTAENDVDRIPMEINDIIKEIKSSGGEQSSSTDVGVGKHRAFAVFDLTIEDDEVKDLKTSCTDEPERRQKCLRNDYHELDHVTRLRIKCNRLKYLGRVENPFMQLFPSLRELEIKASPKKMHVTLIELYYLQKLTLKSFDTRMILHCAFRDSKCLSNPEGLKFMSLRFGSKNSKLEVYGNLRFPKIINRLEIYDEASRKPTGPLAGNEDVPVRRAGGDAASNGDENKDGNEEDQMIDSYLEPERKQTDIFSDIHFDSIVIDYKVIRQGSMSLEDFKNQVVKNRFDITIDQADILEAMPKLLAMGIEDKLVIRVKTTGEAYDVPYLDLKKTTFDDKKFSNCHYGQFLLEKKKLDFRKTSEGTILFIRGYQMKMSEVVNLIKSFKSTPKPQEIRVFVYNIDVDIEPTDLVNDYRKFRIYHVKKGSSGTGSVQPGIKKYNTPKETTAIWPFISFPVQFINLRNAKDPDPIFMRAMATCLMINIADYEKVTLKTLLADNEYFSEWNTLIEQTREYRQGIYNDLEVARTESAYKFLQEYIDQRENQIKSVTKVPLVSLQVLTQNVHILAQTGRDLRDKARHLETLDTIEDLSEKVGDSLKQSLTAIGESKISILQSSKDKSESLGDIELKKQEDLLAEIDNSKELIAHLTTKFDEFAREVETETANFKSGVKLAMGLAIAEAAAEAVNTILSIFSGGFNPVKAIRAAKKAADFGRKLTKIMTVIKKIFELLKKRKLMSTMFKKIKAGFLNKKVKISGFFSRQKRVLSDWLSNKATVLNKLETKDLTKLQSLSEKIKTGLKNFENTKDMVSNTVDFLKAERTVRIGYDPGNPTQSVTLQDKKLATVKETVDEFKDRLAKEATEQGQKLNAIDVFKWTIAKEHVTGMLDTTLSDDVPEATNYRTALLKLITTGETRTQASIDSAALETKFAASTYAWGLYYQEAVFAGEEIEITQEDIDKLNAQGKTDNDRRDAAKEKRNSAEIDVKWEILAIKLEMVRLNEEFCNAYYYFHLEKCKEDLRIGPSNTLDEILLIQNMLLYQSNQKLNDIYPPPQTFTDKTITFMKPKYCQCLAELNKITTNEGTKKEDRKRQVDEVYAATKRCIESDGYTYPASNRGTAEEADRKTTNTLMTKCTDNTIVKDLIDNGEFMYKLDIDSPIFNYHERVRIDEIKLYMKGAKTNNGVLEIFGESTGVSEDRFKHNCFKFLGEKWKRTMSYYSPASVKATAGGIAKRDISDEDWQEMKATIDEISRKLDVNLDNGVTYIDTGNIHKSFSGVFRNPTVFSTWIFKVSNNRNPGLDLSGVEEIQLKFSGSFVSAGDTTAPYQCKAVDEDLLEESIEASKEPKSENKDERNYDTGEGRMLLPVQYGKEKQPETKEAMQANKATKKNKRPKHRHNSKTKHWK